MSFSVLRYWIILAACLSVISARGQGFLDKLMSRYPAYFDTALRESDSLGIQIMYTQIDRSRNNTPVFKDFFYHVDTGRYFYPASTVKLPVALLALERLHELGIDRNTTLLTETGYEGETPASNDPTSPDGRPTVGQYIKEIFLTSDNDAFNRLYEWLGPAYINARLDTLGYKNVQIRHRLDVILREDQNRRANPGRFVDYVNRTLAAWPLRVDSTRYAPRTDVVDGVDFSRKNRLSLADLHDLLKSALFPASVPASRRFDLGADDCRFLYRVMSELPSQTRSPAYDTSEVWDAYVKYLMFGCRKGSLPPSVRIFNKIGEAYGYLIDVAYIADLDKGVEFMLSAVIRCNPDRELGDGHYTYAQTGFPFLQHLGEVIYSYELSRPRRVRPDLSVFRCLYDK
ncbi:serine hydrolase [Dinghuibacter silviterrae]|uniref:beta-lactamase n=1 Tax=Dinghuibacter silviterrae TaxID=1539049 RepID=A0A4R8DSU6_9BACT|nr:serine hydrolase [Dinghuibacter silviterrae]TDX01149.1 beta-lactamase family protein [Dinghuibacter silviterrae]